MHGEVHEAARDVARGFADEVVRPAAAALDRDERFPREIHAAMAEAGLFGITVPEALGGAGLDVLAYALVMEELSRGYAPIADQCGLVELVAAPLARHGTEAQRAPVADVGLVLARTDPGAGHRKMSIFVVDLHADGVSRGPKESKMGQRASTVGALFFDGVRLPGDALLGEEGRGFHLMMGALDRGRVGIGALAVGIAQAGLDAALEHVRERRQFDRPVAEFQGVQRMLADMATDVEAARLLVHEAARKLDAGLDATRACSMAKRFASDAAVSRTSDAVQLFGGSGHARGVEVERLYRDAKITQIYEGTNRIQRTIIARELLAKGPRRTRTSPSRRAAPDG